MHLISVLYLILLFVGFALIHSVMASHTLKKWVFSKFEWLHAWYRLIYNLIAGATFTLWIYSITFFIPTSLSTWYAWPESFSWLGYIVQLIGLAGIIWSFAPIDTNSFLGIRQVIEYYRDDRLPDNLDESESQHLIESGPYRCVRHPLYSFSMLLLWAHPNPTYLWGIATCCCSIYFILGSYFEEKRLRSQYGSNYDLYKERTGRFIPPFRCLFN